jgi:hypothetical protein
MTTTTACPRCGQALTDLSNPHGTIDTGRCEPRPLYVIAREIIKDPASKGSLWCAEPYLSAMLVMKSIDESVGADPGRSIVLYALDNLKQWRGETARRVKAELRSML